MPTTLGPGHLAMNRHFEVQRTNNFEVIFEGLSEDITLSVLSFSPAQVEVGTIEIPYGNTNVKVAGTATFSNASLVVHDYIIADIEKQCMDWFGKVYNPETDAIGWTTQYKRNGRLYQFGPDGTVERTWRLRGAWPTGLQIGDFSYDGGGKKMITMPMNIDKTWIDRSNTSSLANALTNSVLT